MANKISMKDFSPNKSDVILLDTNIIIDLFYPMNVGKDISATASMYGKILKSGAKIIMSAVQISEFVNRCIRFQYALYKDEHPECIDFKKDYRGCEDYNTCMETITDIIRNEWQDKMMYVDDRFNKLPLDKILKQNFAYDFNDAIIVEIANEYNAVFVTNDCDIISYDVHNIIVTNNPLVLKVR